MLNKVVITVTDTCEVLTVFCVSHFGSKIIQGSALTDLVYGKEQPAMDAGLVRDYLHELDQNKSMGTDGLHPRVPRELDDD